MEFDKYSKHGAYHWDDLKEGELRNLLSRSVPTLTRYNKIVAAITQDAKRIVDIGCGDGALSFLIAKNFPDAHVVGCDTNQVAIDLARGKIREIYGGGNLEFVHKSFENCSFDEGSIDVVTMCDVIEHIDQTSSVLNEVKRVGKPGGVLVNTTPYIRTDGVKWDRYHVREYCEESLFEMLSPIFPNTQVHAFSPKIFYDSYRLTKYGFNLLYLIGLNPLNMHLKAGSHTMLFSVSHF